MIPRDYITEWRDQAPWVEDAQYMEHGGHKVARKQFEQNFVEKLKDDNFASDIGPLLASDYEWDLVSMSDKVNALLISRLRD